MAYKIYFAHPLSHYGREIETRCEQAIRNSHWPARLENYWKAESIEIVNPNRPEHTFAYKAIGFGYFRLLAQSCDAVVGVSFEDREFGAGVYTEMAAGFEQGKHVCAIYGTSDNFCIRAVDVRDIRPLSINQTRQRVKDQIL